MENTENIIEYYDELYPVQKEKMTFYKGLINKKQKPVKILNVSCGTGTFEHQLAIAGNDVTGIDISKELLESANRKRRTQLMSLRYFQMSTVEMLRFLGKGFYNIVSCLNNQIIFIHDKILMKKFFFDCKELCSADSILILELYNYKKYKKILPERKSIRVKLSTQIEEDKEESVFLNQKLEDSNGNILPIYSKMPIYPIIKEEIREYAEEAGFKYFKFYSDFSGTEFKDSDNCLICLIS